MTWPEDPKNNIQASGVRDSITVRLPCSTSNLGSGFDTLGLALGLHDTITVRREIDPGRHASPSLQAIIDEAVEAFFKATRVKPFRVGVKAGGKVPPGRGLGASAIARVGTLAGLNYLTQARLTRADLLNLATKLEHHPDNASPALFGGFTVSSVIDGRVQCLRFPVSPRLKFVTLVPQFEIDTQRARALVPQSFSKPDAAHALNRAAMIVAALSKQNYSALRGVFDDRFHHPYRQQLIPELPDVILAGEKAGAIGGFLSGSGSAIICLATDRVREVARAMSLKLPRSKVLILQADNRGMKLVC